MVEKSKKNNWKFEHSVKPYYYPSNPKYCYIVYSEKKELSLKTEFEGLSVKNIKKMFGFDFICGDLVKSVNEAFKYAADNNLLLDYPSSLEPPEDGEVP